MQGISENRKDNHRPPARVNLKNSHSLAVVGENRIHFFFCYHESGWHESNIIYIIIYLYFYRYRFYTRSRLVAMATNLPLRKSLENG